MLFDKNRLGRFVPGPPGTVLIYRAATRDGLNSGNGFFAIVPRSHRMTAGEIKRAKSISVDLKPRGVLFLAANMTIEYVTSGGGVALCEAVLASLEFERMRTRTMLRVWRIMIVIVTIMSREKVLQAASC